MKENGGIVISSEIVDKMAVKKGDSKINVLYNYKNGSFDRWMEASDENFRKKEEGDTVLVLFSPSCRSTIISYDLYPSKSDIKKCLNGCEFEYGKKGLSQLKAKKQ